MGRSEYYDDGIGLDFDEPARNFDLRWPISEVMLSAALKSGRSMNEIAREYGVSVAEVVELCDSYDLDFG